MYSCSDFDVHTFGTTCDVSIHKWADRVVGRTEKPPIIVFPSKLAQCPPMADRSPIIPTRMSDITPSQRHICQHVNSQMQLAKSTTIGFAIQSGPVCASEVGQPYLYTAEREESCNATAARPPSRIATCCLIQLTTPSVMFVSVTSLSRIGFADAHFWHCEWAMQMRTRCCVELTCESLQWSAKESPISRHRSKEQHSPGSSWIHPSKTDLWDISS